jgi:hypothetical protein
MQTGVRGAQRPAPGNSTGVKFYQQQRELASKKKTEEVDWYKVGWNAGFDFGYDAGVQAVIRQLQAEGVIDADEPSEDE